MFTIPQSVFNNLAPWTNPNPTPAPIPVPATIKISFFSTVNGSTLPLVFSGDTIVSGMLTPNKDCNIALSCFISGVASVPGSIISVFFTINGNPLRDLEIESLPTGNFNGALSCIAVGPYPAGIPVPITLRVNVSQGNVSIPTAQAGLNANELAA